MRSGSRDFIFRSAPCPLALALRGCDQAVDRTCLLTVAARASGAERPFACVGTPKTRARGVLCFAVGITGALLRQVVQLYQAHVGTGIGHDFVDGSSARAV
jgi:hypothetical protein